MSGQGEAGPGAERRGAATQAGPAAGPVLGTILGANPDPVFALDRDCRYLAFNAAHAAVMKALYGAEIGLGHSLFEYQDVAADAAGARANIDKTLAGETIVEEAYSGDDARERRFFEVTHRPIREGDTVVGALVTARDVTERRRERASARIRERALEASINAIALADLEWRVTYVNPAFLRLWGYDRLDEVLGRPVRDFWASLDDTLAVRDAMLGSGGWTGEMTGVRGDGETFFARVITSVVQDDDGAPVGSLAAVLDISDKVRTEEALLESEARLRGVLENLQDAYFRAGLSGRLTFVSNSAAAMFGYASAADMVGMPAADLYAEPGARDEMLARLRETGIQHDFETPGARRDGTTFWVSLSTQVLFDADGRPCGTEGLARDISERVRAEQALRESETHFRAFFERANIGMATTSPEKGWIEVNAALCGMLGRSPEELRRLTWAELTHPDDLAADVTQFERLVAGDIDGYVLDKRFVRGDGGIVHTHLVVHAVRESGRPGFAYVAAMLEDVSDRVRAERELRRLNAELELRVEARTAQLQEANRELESFAYSVSHDLRAPLRALDGFSEILAEDYGTVLDAEGLRHLARIRAAAQRMGELIDALLALSRLTRLEPATEDVDLSATARRIGERLRRAEPGRRVELTVEPGCCARADARLAEAVLGNLLDNAWKFTARRDLAHIEVGHAEVDGELVFFVRDDGAGFDMSYADKLFEPFQRLHATEEYPGTGIGLASVRRIVSRLGGRCWAEGAEGVGATFSFTLGPPAC